MNRAAFLGGAPALAGSKVKRPFPSPCAKWQRTKLKRIAPCQHYSISGRSKIAALTRGMRCPVPACPERRVCASPEPASVRTPRHDPVTSKALGCWLPGAPPLTSSRAGLT